MSALKTATLLACFAILAHTATAEAGLVVRVQDTTAFAGSTGNELFVTVTNTGDTQISIGGFSFESNVPNADISFTDVTIGASPTFAYIFDHHSLFGPDITTPGQDLPGRTIAASDNDDEQNEGTTLNSGDTFGLGIVSFDVAPSAPSETIPVTFSAYPSTSFSDPDNNTVTPGEVDGGTITVLPQATPEPSGLCLILSGLILLGSRRFFRKPGSSASNSPV